MGLVNLGRIPENDPNDFLNQEIRSSLSENKDSNSKNSNLNFDSAKFTKTLFKSVTNSVLLAGTIVGSIIINSLTIYLLAKTYLPFHLSLHRCVGLVLLSLFLLNLPSNLLVFLSASRIESRQIEYINSSSRMQIVKLEKPEKSSENLISKVFLNFLESCIRCFIMAFLAIFFNWLLVHP